MVFSDEGALLLRSGHTAVPVEFERLILNATGTTLGIAEAQIILRILFLSNR